MDVCLYNSKVHLHSVEVLQNDDYDDDHQVDSRKVLHDDVCAFCVSSYVF